jgi:AcrR family transcriptional regulator
MATADRRRAILDVAMPLLIEKGAAVTTAEIAQAAGIAEGTIFRAFPDKSTLIFDVVKSTMDPAPVAAAIREISRTRSLEARLADAARLLSDYFNQVTAIGECLRAVSMQGGVRHGDVGKVVKESSATITAALTEFFEHHRKALRVSPSNAVAAFRGLVFASVHPMLPPRDRLKTEEVARILMSGIALNKGE